MAGLPQGQFAKIGGEGRGLPRFQKRHEFPQVLAADAPPGAAADDVAVTFRRTRQPVAADDPLEHLVGRLAAGLGQPGPEDNAAKPRSSLFDEFRVMHGGIVYDSGMVAQTAAATRRIEGGRQGRPTRDHQ